MALTSVSPFGADEGSARKKKYKLVVQTSKENNSKKEKDVLEFTLISNFENILLDQSERRKNKGKIGKQVRINTRKKEQEEKRSERK